MASICTNLTGAARVVRLLKVDGYSASTSICTTRTKPSVGTGDEGYIKSRWNVGGYEWEIRLYPATLIFGIGYYRPLFRKCSQQWSYHDVIHWDSETRWLAVRLVCLSKLRTGSVRAALGCRLVDTRGLLEPSEEKSVSHVFGVYDQIQHSSGEVVLMERHDLAASGYLRDDCLTVQCAVTVLKELPVPTIPAKQVIAPPTNMHLHLAQLQQSATGADVTFLVSGESFPAHKNILAARSPVFMAEFFGDMKEKSSQSVEIQDMEAAVFKTLLHFIYTDTVPELEKQKEASTVVMAQHLLAASDRYGLDRLKLICEAITTVDAHGRKS